MYTLYYIKKIRGYDFAATGDRGATGEVALLSVKSSPAMSNPGRTRLSLLFL